jgi:hypothetical protein
MARGQRLRSEQIITLLRQIDVSPPMAKPWPRPLKK